MTLANQQLPASLLNLANRKGPCLRCGCEVEGATICDQCGESWQPFAGERTSWATIAGGKYLDTDPDDERIVTLVRAVESAAAQLDPGQGIGIVGRRGTGKTRAAHYALRALGSTGIKIVNHVDFGKAATEAQSGEQRQDAKERLKAWQQCRILLIDDLGKAAPTERATEALYDILEHRQPSEYSTWWTTEWKGRDLEPMLGARGPAIIRRLREFSVIITP